jgi:large subunit ribosomal protein L31
MKKDTHPEYNFVVLEDSSANYRFLTRSTMKVDATKTTVWEDGETYQWCSLKFRTQATLSSPVR